MNESESDLFHEFWKQFSELNLSLIDRQIFWLAERNGFTTMKIAERTGIPKSTANNKPRRVKRKYPDYLNAVNTFFNWIQKIGSISHQALTKIEKVDIRDKQQKRQTIMDESSEICLHKRPQGVDH